jgi:hypothetical protein
MHGLQDNGYGQGELRVEEDNRDRNETRATIWLPEQEREWVRYWRGLPYEACIEIRVRMGGSFVALVHGDMQTNELGSVFPVGRGRS